MQDRAHDDSESQSLKDWKSWEAVTLSIVPLLRSKDFAPAVSLIDDFVRRELEHEVRSCALGMRAYLKESLGDLEGAKSDLLAAISVAPDSFGKHLNEVALAEIHRKQGNRDEVVRWYRQALITCAGSKNRVSGGLVIDRFLELQSDRAMSKQDRELCDLVAERSWRVWNLPGRPDLGDLRSVVATIMREERNPNSC